MRKRGEKTGDSINEKLPDPMGTEEENRSFRCFARGENPPKPNQENGGGKPKDALDFLAPWGTLKKS